MSKPNAFECWNIYKATFPDADEAAFFAGWMACQQYHSSYQKIEPIPEDQEDSTPVPLTPA